MRVGIQITDQTLYKALVDHVELENLTVESGEIFTGHIQVYRKTGTVKPFYGLLEACDFEEEFGFKLCVEEITGKPKTV